MPSDEHAEVAVAPNIAELDPVRTAIIDAASVSGGLWISFVAMLFYLLVAVGSVTYVDLFLESSVKLPILFVDLPTRGFALIAPMMFLIAHAYLLLHFAILSDKIAVYNRKIAAMYSDLTIQSDFRRLLPTNVFVLFLAGPIGIRDGITGLFLRVIAQFTMVFCPVLLLCFVEVQFLPYHSHFVTWSHRCAAMLDIALLWLFWPRITLREFPATLPRQRLTTARPVMWMAVVTPIVLLFVATFPGELTDPIARRLPGRNFLVGGDISARSLHVTAVFSNILDLPKFDAIAQAKLDDDEKLKRASHSIVVEGRNLRRANLKFADLRKAHLYFSDLTDADLGSAHLADAQLDGADLSGADLGFADLSNTSLTDAILRGTRLDGANLTSARLDGQAQLDLACGTTDKLPKGLTLKPCPPR